jgi:hypothetical protein
VAGNAAGNAGKRKKFDIGMTQTATKAPPGHSSFGRSLIGV